MAFNLDKEVEKLLEQSALPHVRYDTKTQKVIVRLPSGKEKRIDSRHLRLKCKSAVMIDELTGRNLFKDTDIPQDVFPFKIEPKGNYAVAVAWSDGHKASLYPYEYLMSDDIKGEIVEDYNPSDKPKSGCH
jgi:DUF971 family protein